MTSYVDMLLSAAMYDLTMRQLTKLGYVVRATHRPETSDSEVGWLIVAKKVTWAKGTVQWSISYGAATAAVNVGWYGSTGAFFRRSGERRFEAVDPAFCDAYQAFLADAAVVPNRTWWAKLLTISIWFKEWLTLRYISCLDRSITMPIKFKVGQWITYTH